MNAAAAFGLLFGALVLMVIVIRVVTARRQK